MKKILIGLAILMFLPAAALAYPVIITDRIDNFPGTHGTTETYSITIDTNPGLSISILTNQPKYSDDPLDLYGFLGRSRPLADVADLFLDLHPNNVGWDYAIPLVTHGNFVAGRVYQVQSTGGSLLSIWETDEVPYRIASGTAMGWYGTWTWTNAGRNPDYNILYSGANWSWDSLGQESVRIAWATASCKNDIIVGEVSSAPVPEPATMLLLGSGLIGIAGFGRKKLFKK